MNEVLKDLVVFGATWCNQCKDVKAMLEGQGTEFTYLDVDSPAGKALAQDYAVRGLPQGFYNGERVFLNVPQARGWLNRNGANIPKGAEDDVRPMGYPNMFDAPPGVIEALAQARKVPREGDGRAPQPMRPAAPQIFFADEAHDGL